jgi:hypothetical protein
MGSELLLNDIFIETLQKHSERGKNCSYIKSNASGIVTIVSDDRSYVASAMLSNAGKIYWYSKDSALDAAIEDYGKVQRITNYVMRGPYADLSIKLSDFILLDMAQFEGNPLTERIIAKFLHRTTKKLLLYGSHLSDHQRIINALLDGVYKKNYAMTINDSHHFGFSVIENLNPREASQVLP